MRRLRMVALSDWYELNIKDSLRETGLSDPSLHVAAGLVILLLALLLLRRPAGSWLALLAVALAEAMNELCDRLHYGSWRWPDTLDDIVHTLALPLLLVLAGQAVRWAMRGRERRLIHEGAG